MIKKILTFILFAYISVLLPYIVYNKNNNIEDSFYIKYIVQELIIGCFKYGYDGTIYLNDNDNILSPINDNKIDIIISNHNSILNDIMLIIIVLHKYNINTYNFIYHINDLQYIPSLGLLLKSSYDIGIQKNYEKDYNTIINGINKINVKNNKYFLIIFPEGAVNNEQKIMQDQLKSIKYYIPVYNNLLIPRIKGLYLIIEYLKYLKRFGNIWDFTLYNNNNNYYIDIKKVNLDYNNYDEFKSQLYKIWTRKDNIINHWKINKDNNLKYNKIFFKNNYNIILLLILIIIIQSIILCNFKYLILFICKIIYFYFV